MLFGGLSEHWLLKELGDMHWGMITKGLGVDSDKLVDSRGERLYASFVRLRWQGNTNLFSFKENQELLLKSQLSRYGSKMFFSDALISTLRIIEIKADLMSVFSSRQANDNTRLQKGSPLVPRKQIKSKHTQNYLHLPKNTSMSRHNGFLLRIIRLKSKQALILMATPSPLVQKRSIAVIIPLIPLTMSTGWGFCILHPIQK